MARCNAPRGGEIGSDPMAVRPHPLVAGNWKMNGLRKALDAVAAIRAAVSDGGAGEAEVLLCLPATLLMEAARICDGSPLRLGGQDCHSEPCGAFTGDISAEMLRDAGASYVIVGHSERRTAHDESDGIVKSKAEAAVRAGLEAIICVGETSLQREAGIALDVVAAQLAGSIPASSTPKGIVVAYEPVWAIGTGLVPTPKDIAEVHGFIRATAGQIWRGEGDRLRILYGGSVKPANAADLMRIENVDGALVGGASLVAEEFMAISGVFR
jgi:triosephosphate isomerase